MQILRKGEIIVDFITEWLRRITGYYECEKALLALIAKCKDDIEKLTMQKNICSINLLTYKEVNASLGEKIKALEAQIPQSNEFEILYNNKYPKANITYSREETDGSYEIDVRNFITYKDCNLPLIIGKTDDEKAYNCLMWVINNIKYVPDKNAYNFGEYWAMPWQTLKRKLADCEDGSNLIHALMLKAGVPYWKCRGTAGLVNIDSPQKGHAYTTYFYEEGKRWISLDWCFHQNKLAIKDRIDYKEDKLYENVWFSYNRDFSFSSGLNTEAKSFINMNTKTRRKKNG